jgi:hypothetical protein
MAYGSSPEAEFLDKILLVIQTTLQLCLAISIFSNSRNPLVSVKKIGGKPDRKPYLLPYKDYAQKPQCNCTFMNSASEHRVLPWLAIGDLHHQWPTIMYSTNALCQQLVLTVACSGEHLC